MDPATTDSSWLKAGQERARRIGGWHCEVCARRRIVTQLTEETAIRHHKWPRALGGESKEENCEIRCSECERADKHWLSTNKELVIALLLNNELCELMKRAPRSAFRRLPHNIHYYHQAILAQHAELNQPRVDSKVVKPERSRFFNKQVEVGGSNSVSIGHGRFATARFG